MKLKEILFNPFTKIAGGKSLILGSSIVIISSVLAYFTDLKFDGIVDLHSGELPSFWVNLLLGLANFIVFSIFLYVFGLLFSKTHIRFIDVIGTQSLARYPYILAPIIFLLIPKSLNDETILNAILEGEPIQITYLEITGFLIFILLSLVLLIWVIILMYNANKIATNTKGRNAVFSFILSFIFSSIALRMIWNYFTVGSIFNLSLFKNII